MENKTPDQIIVGLEPQDVKIFEETSDESSKVGIDEISEKDRNLKAAYRLEKDHVGAIQAAYFSGRPLLVRGDPGLGKTRLADAIAALLQWGQVKVVVHYNSTIEDVMYDVDALQRMQDATEKKIKPMHEYLRPGKIWQALAPHTLEQYQSEPPHNKTGTVLLIDEIDKADSSLPNALLEVLDAGEITHPYQQGSIKSSQDHPVFVVITSNNERILPAAFLRRCAVLDLTLKESNNGGLDQLLNVYNIHAQCDPLIDEIPQNWVEDVAKFVLHERQTHLESQYKPGTAEFLDVLRALCRFEEQDRGSKLDILKKHLLLKN